MYKCSLVYECLSYLAGLNDNTSFSFAILVAGFINKYHDKCVRDMEPIRGIKCLLCIGENDNIIPRGRSKHVFSSYTNYCKGNALITHYLAHIDGKYVFTLYACH